MTKKAFAAKMNLYDEKYGEFAALFCKTPPEEYGNVIEYLNMLQTLEIDFPGILSEPIEEESDDILVDRAEKDDPKSIGTTPPLPE